MPVGDAIAGQEAFVYMQCHQCHTISGLNLPSLPHRDPPYVQLGSATSAMKGPGDLTTAIINPSHKLASGYAEDAVSDDGESRMYVYNRHMSVQELVDIVAFLESSYGFQR